MKRPKNRQNDENTFRQVLPALRAGADGHCRHRSGHDPPVGRHRPHDGARNRRRVPPSRNGRAGTASRAGGRRGRMRGPAKGRCVAVSRHARHPGAENRGFALYRGLSRREGRPRRVRPDRRIDAGQLRHIPDVLAARPGQEQDTLYRPRIPRAAQSGAHPRHPLGVVRHLRLPG